MSSGSRHLLHIYEPIRLICQQPSLETDDSIGSGSSLCPQSSSSTTTTTTPTLPFPFCTRRCLCYPPSYDVLSTDARVLWSESNHVRVIVICIDACAAMSHLSAAEEDVPPFSSPRPLKCDARKRKIEGKACWVGAASGGKGSGCCLTERCFFTERGVGYKSAVIHFPRLPCCSLQ